MIDRLKPNGVLPLFLGWRYAKLQLEFTGGPFDFYPAFAIAQEHDNAYGVCVRAEQVTKALSPDVHLPIRDFSVPENPAAVAGALTAALSAAIAGKKVYIGCMGGWGRTGLFMALLAKAAGIENPVEYVRLNYTPRAVETEKQEHYVEDFDVSAIQKALVWQAWKARFKRLFRL